VSPSQRGQHSLFDTPGEEASLRAASSRAIRVMEDHMTARGFAQAEWFAADHATIADIALFPAFALSRDFGIDHDEYPALRRWARRFRYCLASGRCRAFRITTEAREF